ncbi:MAG: hypothetical protein LBP72_01860, partial [Dysgonamonadaceae bacterium]|nr:hypothetical protein [Dysgonamonadaceae bacterium]
MRTKILVLSIALTLSANLRAQVTIGSVNEPKAGAILDLNSGAKGGLILSNVGLDNPTEIPAGFPGMSGADIAVAKAQLKGAMVYNTNENTCIGVHAWNGDYWERIAPSLVMAPGTTLTSSNAASAFGGDIINFTASLPGAKTYRWYASESNKPYEYLGMTTTNTYSKAFPTGNYKVKAIMDDCHAPAESNELPFAPTSLSPSFGSLNGGNTIYIYGDFPYAATSDYAQLGLVAHYDGINNRDLGDKRHDYNATAWKDLKSGFELARGTGAGQWLSNGFQSLETTLLTTSVVRSFFSNSVPGAYPIGGAARTVEVIFKTPEAANMFTQLQDIERSIFRYGESANHKQFGVLYRGVKAAACPTDNQWMFYAIAGGVSNLITCLSSTPSLETANTINTVTSTYQNNMNDPLTNSY